MKLLYLVNFFIFLFLFTGCTKSPTAYESAATMATKMLKDGESPGMAITLSRDNKVIWSKGFGYADLENLTPVYPGKTRFRIGSISKAVTSAGMGVLIHEGKIDVDLPVQEYVPYFPEKRWPVTTRQVAGHLAGIRHYRDSEFLSGKYYATVREGLEIFMNDTLLFEPSTQYSYSSYGYNLISAILEEASGIPFLEFMQQKVFVPAGLKYTVADLKDTIITYRSGFYDMDEGRVINAPYVDNSYKWAGGGYLSTSEDMVKFGNVVLYSVLFPDSIGVQLTTSQHTSDGKETGYGMGWSTGVNEGGRKFYGHGGGSVGGSCNLIIFPDEKLVIAALTNDSRSRTGKELHELAELFMD